MKKNRAVLLIDNDFAEIISLERYLVELNLNLSLFTAATYNDGLEILCGDKTRIKPEIVLVNVDMDLKAAREFLKLIRNYYSLRHIKLFILTSSSVEELLPLKKEIDITGILRKPLDFCHITDKSCLAGYNQLINALM